MGFNAARSIFLSSFDPDRRKETTSQNKENIGWLYLGSGYAEVMDFLCLQLTGPANVKALVAEPGLGKTMLLRSAVERLKAEARATLVSWTMFSPQDFVEHLLAEMGSAEPPPQDLSAAQNQFEKLLRDAQGEGRRLVLAIDDAHNLSAPTLRSLAVLLDRDTASPPQVTVLLAGLPSLNGLLADPEAKGIRERIAGVKTIEPLSAEQTADYIAARMSAIGHEPVDPERAAIIASTSGGVLREIDKLCGEAAPQKESWQQRIKSALGVAAPDASQEDDWLNGRPGPPTSKSLNERPIPRAETPVALPKINILARDRSVTQPKTNPDTAANGGSLIIAAHVSRLAEWTIARPGTWSGTMGALAEATGIAADEISDAVENRIPELRRSGVDASIQRLPGKPRMITLSRIQPDISPQPRSANMERPADTERPAIEKPAVEAPTTKEIFDVVENRAHLLRSSDVDDSIRRSNDKQSADKRSADKPRIKAPLRVKRNQAIDSPDPIAAPRLMEASALPIQQSHELEAPSEINTGPAIETGLHWTDAAEEPNMGLAVKVAVSFMVIVTLAAFLFYLMAPSSKHRAASLSQRTRETKQSSEADEVTGLLTDKTRLASYEAAANKGDPIAQRRLGLALSLENGGAAGDRVAAYTWLVMAGSGGQAVNKSTLDSLSHSFTPKEMRDVRYRLGRMYERGIGGAPNPVLADEWFLLGVAADDLRSRARSAAVERRMSPAQISQAHTLSDEWLRVHAN